MTTLGFEAPPPAAAAETDAPMKRRRIPALTWRIVLFNLVALIVLLAGVLWVMATRVDLVDERILSLTNQAKMIAGALGEAATAGPDASAVDPEMATPLLRRLLGPTNVRARLFGRDGALQLDTLALIPRNQVVTYALPPPGRPFETWSLFETLYDWGAGMLPARALPLYREGEGFALYPELASAAKAQEAHMVRQNERGEMVVSVAVPVQRYQFVLGVLMLSMEGGDIAAIVRADRIAVLQFAGVAAVALVLSSILLAAGIAAPMRKLAEAADLVRRGVTGRAHLPDLSRRNDEIGDLSASLGHMTDALNKRLDAIERFAADVAHEIKNPLTSLRSAVETLTRQNDPAKAEALLAVIQDDVRRIDRLVTDIADASRLDAEMSRERFRPVALASMLQHMTELSANDDVRIAFVRDLGAAGDDALRVRGLEGPLAQVFRNVIENAVSFSPDGGAVTVRASISSGQAVVTVDDDGPGIPPDMLERIFERFYTERPPEHGFGKNSGLGLAIARQIVALHGGDIRAANRPEGGARFTVRLPLSAL